MLERVVTALLEDAFKLDMTSRAVQALHFFLADSIKILLLLFVMILFIGILRTYLPRERMRKWLTGRSRGVGNIVASAFGAVTPFCSCSSIPIFLGFLKAGVPLGVAFSFLITSPLVNEYLVVLMLALFGWKITLAYVISGMLIGIIAGLILGSMKLEGHLVADVTQQTRSEKESHYRTLRERFRFGLDEAISITRKLWLWILIGVGIAAAIHNYVPQEAITRLLDSAGIFAVPLAVLVGIPLYGSGAALVPVALALFEKGVPLGTALALMMATAALSLPEAIMLRRAMRLRLIIIFFSIVALAIVITGYLLNALAHILI